MQNSVKKGRVNIETLYLVEKGALLFLSINLIAASLGIDKLAWSQNRETEFVFGWNSWTQTDTSNTGIVVIRDRAYTGSECTIASCDATELGGRIFFFLNVMAIILLVCCCVFTLEMAVFHYTKTFKKFMNVFLAFSAFAFNLTAWSFWVAKSDTTPISQQNAGASTRHASSFWYSLLACFFLLMYCMLVLKQNVSNFLDKRKLREEARPLPASSIPTARSGRGYQDKEISKLVKSRIITTGSDPAPPTIPDLPRKLTAEPDEDAVTIRKPSTRLTLKNMPPPPLPPRVTPVVRLAGGPPGLPKRRSRGLPAVRASSLASLEKEVDRESDEDSVGEGI